MCSPDSMAQTRSNELSGKSIFSASFSSNLALGTPCALASLVARAICASEIEMPVTVASGNFLAR